MCCGEGLAHRDNKAADIRWLAPVTVRRLPAAFCWFWSFRAATESMLRCAGKGPRNTESKGHEANKGIFVRVLGEKTSSGERKGHLYSINIRTATFIRLCTLYISGTTGKLRSEKIRFGRFMWRSEDRLFLCILQCGALEIRLRRESSRDNNVRPWMCDRL